MSIIITTSRLYLRTWTSADSESYFQINQDPRVIEFLRGPLTKTDVTNFIETMNRAQAERGYSLWAVEHRASGALMGFIGLIYRDFPASFTPAVEIGWRLGSAYWQQGYATEGAKAVLAYGFTQCALPEIVSFTVPENLRSRLVMEKIGLKPEPTHNFLHPQLPRTHPLALHVLYRLRREEFRARAWQNF